MKNIRRFFASALLITFSALIIRSISVSFSSYVASNAGEEAMGLFSLIMSVFGFALTVATSGVNLAVTRMISEAMGKRDDGLVRKSMRRCIKYALGFSLTAALLLFILSKPIGSKILNEPRVIISLKILSCALPFISLTSAFSGYFTAVRRVAKSTLYSISEQLIKIFFTVKMFEIFIPLGVEYACIALVISDTISEISAFLMSAIMYYFDKKKHFKKSVTSVSDKEITRQLCSIALPVAASTYIRSALLTIEHILIPRGLIKSGLDRSDALSSYGLLHSMVMPIVLFPTAILSSFSGLLIPELAEAAVKEKKAQIRYIAERALQFSLIFSFITAGILTSLSGMLGELIYGSEEVGYYIRIMAPLVPIMYLDSVTDAILKGLGQQVYSMNVNIVDAILSIICVLILLPKYGIMGYIITIYTNEILNATLSIVRMLNVTGMRPRIYKFVMAPLCSVICSTVLGKIIFSVINSSLPMLSEIIISGFLTVIIYAVLIRLTGAISKRDSAWLKNALNFRRFSEDRSSDSRDARKYTNGEPQVCRRNIRKC